jgi:plasmid stabilization system protein ParE
VAGVEIGAVAVEDRGRIIVTHSLPSDTRQRVRRKLASLESFPRIGRQLEGRWHPMRFLLGPWRWMLIVYRYSEAANTVLIVTIQDARSSTSATTEQ